MTKCFGCGKEATTVFPDDPDLPACEDCRLDHQLWLDAGSPARRRSRWDDDHDAKYDGRKCGD